MCETSPRPVRRSTRKLNLNLKTETDDWLWLWILNRRPRDWIRGWRHRRVNFEFQFPSTVVVRCRSNHLIVIPSTFCSSDFFNPQWPLHSVWGSSARLSFDYQIESYWIRYIFSAILGHFATTFYHYPAYAANSTWIPWVESVLTLGVPKTYIHSKLQVCVFFVG